MDQDSPNYRITCGGSSFLFEGAAMVADGCFIDISGLPFGDGQDLGMLTPSHRLSLSVGTRSRRKSIAAIDVGEGCIVQNVKK